jgi:hypothetical protein
MDLDRGWEKPWVQRTCDLVHNVPFFVKGKSVYNDGERHDKSSAVIDQISL